MINLLALLLRYSDDEKDPVEVIQFQPAVVQYEKPNGISLVLSSWDHRLIQKENHKSLVLHFAGIILSYCLAVSL